MPIQVTNAGLEAIRQADEGGFKIKLARFAVSEKADVELNVTDTELEGVAVYSSAIALIEPIGTSTVKLTMDLPRGRPQVGKWDVCEIAFYLDNGAMFAHGKFGVPYTKIAAFKLRLVTYVTASQLGAVVNVVVSEAGAGIATASTVRGLQPPTQVPNYVVAVLDQKRNPDGSYLPSVAVKRGIEWSFLGSTRLYSGLVSNPSSANFRVESRTNGFWLNHGELVLVQVLTGLGAGESRKASFNANTNVFTVLERPFSALGATSRVSIWRSDSEALPSRTADIPPHYMLGVGRNTWARTAVAHPSGSLALRRLTFTGSESNLYVFEGVNEVSQGALEQSNDFLVFVGGQARKSSQFAISPGTPGNLSFASDALPQVGAKIEVVYLELVASSGAESFLIEATDTSLVPQKIYPLPVIVESLNSLLVFVEDELVARDAYVLSSNNVVFDTEIEALKSVTILVWAAYNSPGNLPSWKRTEFAGNGVKVDFDTQVIITDPSKVVVTVGGKLCSKSQYEILGTDSLVRFFLPPSAGVAVSVLVLSETASTEEHVSTGLNTGPVWQDPAGVEGLPNSLVPKLKAYTADGVSTDFPIFKVKHAGRVLVFVGGRYFGPSLWRMSPDGESVTLLDAPQAGMRIDIRCFTEVESAGVGVNCGQTSYAADGLTNNFGLSRVAKTQDCVMATVGGVYQHQGSYTLDEDGLSITFDGMPENGQAVRLWVYAESTSATYAGLYTDVQMNIATADDQSLYRLKTVPSQDSNAWVFLGHVAQAASAYNVSPSGLTMLDPMAPLTGLELVAHCFVSIQAKTRLILREEYEILESKVAGLEGLDGVVSSDEGNLLESRPNGLYYGTVASADVAVMYVDAVLGLDTNPGTRLLPVRTIREALSRGGTNLNRTLFLHESQIHEVDPAARAYFRGGNWDVLPYGTGIDALNPVVGDGIEIQASAIPLYPTIKSKPFTRWGNAGTGFTQTGVALAPAKGAFVTTRGINFYCGRPNTTIIPPALSPDPLSSYCGTFHDPNESGTWYMRAGTITLPTASSRFYSALKVVPVSCILGYMKLTGSGKFAAANSKLFTLNLWEGLLSDLGCSQDQMRGYLSLQTEIGPQYSDFNTNVKPPAPSWKEGLARQAGVIYTNSTGQDVHVSVQFKGGDQSLYVSSIVVGRATAPAGDWNTLYAVVPHGSTYKVVSTADEIVWKEYRV